MYVRVDLHPSLLLRGSRAAFHVAALLCLPWINLDNGLLVILALMIGGSLWRCTIRPLSHPRAILFIDGAPRLLFDDLVVGAVLQEYVYCTSFLQILHFRRRGSPDDRQLCVVILPDSSCARDRRRLRTLLRWQTLEAPILHSAKDNEKDHV